MLLRKISGYLSAYTLWIIVLLLAIWLAIISQSALLGLAAVYYVDDMYAKEVLIRFLDKAYMLTLGLSWIVLMVICEETFRKAMRKGGLFRKFAAVCGIELLAIFFFDFTLLFLQNWPLIPLRLSILAFELTLGIVLVYYWRKKKSLKLI